MREMLRQGDTGIGGQSGSPRDAHNKANPLEARGESLPSNRTLVPHSTRSPDKRCENKDSLRNFKGSQLEETLFSPRMKGTSLRRQDSSYTGQTCGQR